MSEPTVETIEIGGRAPEAVYRPRSLQELQALVKERDGTTLVPVAGRTQLALGSRLEGRFSVVDVTAALQGQVEHAPEDLTAVVPAATTLEALAGVLGAAGQHLPIDPPLAEAATLGGALAVGVGGPLRSRYGLPRDMVLGMTVLRADGELVHAGGRVVKNVTGYDLMRMWCGSLGTLGIVTSVSVRVLPRAESVDLECAVPDVKAGLAVADTLVARDIRPEYLDLCSSDGRWLVAARIPAAAVGEARNSLEGRTLSESPAGRYRTLRDTGFQSAGILTVRLAALPSEFPGLLKLVDPLRPSAVLARPLGSFMRVCWDSRSLPSAREFEGLLHTLRTRLAGYGGSVIIERMPERFHGPIDAWGPPPSAFPLMQRMKQVFDPDGRLNRGRFIGGI